MNVYAPPLPHACSNDESASRITYTTRSSGPATASIAITPSTTARSVASTATSRMPRNPRTSRASAAAPMVAGSAYAATASPVQTPAWSGGAICTASHATATMLIPSPSAETSIAGRTRRSLGWLSTRPTSSTHARPPDGDWSPATRRPAPWLMAGPVSSSRRPGPAAPGPRCRLCRSGLRSPAGSPQLVDADQVARGIAEGAVANPVRLLGRLLDDLGAAGLHPLEGAVEVGGGQEDDGVAALGHDLDDGAALVVGDAGVGGGRGEGAGGARLVRGAGRDSPHPLVSDVVADLEAEGVAIEGQGGVRVVMREEAPMNGDVHGGHASCSSVTGASRFLIGLV